MGNPPTHLPGSLRHSPRGSLETGIGVCGQGGNRGHLCLLHPHSLVCPGTRWKQFTWCWWCQGLRLTVAWTSRSPEALARAVGLRPQAPTLSFLLVSLPGGSLLGLLSHLFTVNLSLYLEDSNRRWVHLTHLITSSLDVQCPWGSFLQELQLWGSPFGIPDHSTSDSGKQEYG